MMARQVIKAQSEEISQFRRLRKQWYGSGRFSEYRAMGEMMRRSMAMAPNMMGGLMSSPRFDYEFLSGMIPHHAGAITIARWETQAGTHAALRKIAAHIIRDQSREIGDMIQLRATWYGN